MTGTNPSKETTMSDDQVKKTAKEFRLHALAAHYTAYKRKALAICDDQMLTAQSYVTKGAVPPQVGILLPPPVEEDIRDLSEMMAAIFESGVDAGRAQASLASATADYAVVAPTTKKKR